MKILVTGALGHIGSKLIRQLPKHFDLCEIIMVDNLSTQRYASLFNLPNNKQFKFLSLDLLSDNTQAVLQPFSNIDAIVHLAAITDATSSFNNKELVANNNFNSTRAIAEFCLQNNINLIYPSSTSVYGSQSKEIDEFCSDHELKPQSPYAETKLKEEKFLQQQYEKQSLKVCILRLGTIFGPSPGMRFHTAVNKFCWQAIFGEKLTVWQTAFEQMRPYLDLNDAIETMVFVIKNKLFDGQVYNAVTANHTPREVIEIIKQQIPDVSIDFVKTKIMNQLSYRVANKRLHDKGFCFSGNLTQGINDTLALLKGAHSL